MLSNYKGISETIKSLTKTKKYDKSKNKEN